MAKKLRVGDRGYVSPYLKRRCKERGITRGPMLRACLREENVFIANRNKAERRALDFASEACVDEGFKPKTPGYYACVDAAVDRAIGQAEHIRPARRRAGKLRGSKLTGVLAKKRKR